MPDTVVIATWGFGQTAVVAAELLRQGKSALDAAIALNYLLAQAKEQTLVPAA